MTWNASEIETKLTNALNSFNWLETEQICNELIAEIYLNNELFPEKIAKNILYELRRKQCFNLMTSLAEAFIRSRLRPFQILRQYAQGLIDQGMLTTAEFVLNFIIVNAKDTEDPKIKREKLEAHGLIGRIYKQLYINSQMPKTIYSQQNLQRALDAYLGVYNREPGETWHGINAAAILKRARRDKIPLPEAPDPNIIAVKIIEVIDERETRSIERRLTLSTEELAKESNDPLAAWDIATKIEALIATGDYFLAEELTLRYAEHDETDAFEIASTLRQLKEVWNLNIKEPPGSNILSILNAAHLKKRGASVIVHTDKVEQEQIRVQEAFEDLEAKFGGARTQSLLWLKTGLKRCESIARIERLDGKGHGTGWLVDGGDFFPGQKGQLMVLTNYHVVSPIPRFPRALLYEEAQVHFQVHDEIFKVESIFWSSSPEKLDATFLKIGGKPKAEPLPLAAASVILGDPPPRLFVIGHPGGRDIELSLEDNLLVAAGDKVIHYRAPTEKGSSGSPVFDEVGWQVVALHHAGSSNMRRLDNPQAFYEANEGIKISAIIEQTQTFSPASPL